MIRVWDPLLRVLHWLLVGSVAVGWLSTLESLAAIGRWHQAAGWLALGVVVVRYLWGFGPSHYARWTQFLRGPAPTLAYARAVWAHRERRHVGHNPLGAWMVVALFACIAGLALTGWLYTTDRFFGDETVEQVHAALAWALLALVAVHVAGVIFTSVRQRENLVRAMFDGRKPAPRGDDVA